MGDQFLRFLLTVGKFKNPLTVKRPKYLPLAVKVTTLVRASSDEIYTAVSLSTTIKHSTTSQGSSSETLKYLCTYFSKNEGLLFFSSSSSDFILISVRPGLLIGAKTGTSDRTHVHTAMEAPEK